MDRPGLALALGKRKLKFFILPAMRIRNQSLESFLFRIYYILREEFIKKKSKWIFVHSEQGSPLIKLEKNIGSKKCSYVKKFFFENFPTLPMNIGIHFPLLSPYLGISICGSKLEGGGVTRHKKNFFTFLHDSEHVLILTFESGKKCQK